MTKNNKYCLYFHINPLKNEIFYVGIGNKDRPYYKYNRSNFWHKIANKYGYIVDIIETNLTLEKACELEVFYIKKIGRRNLNLGSLVNLTDGGEGKLNYVITDDARIKMSKAAMGKIVSEETKLKISKATVGSNNGYYGKIHSEEIREKISKSKKGKDNLKRRVPIIQLDLNNTPIKEWEGASVAAKELGITNIVRVLKGRAKVAGKFKWKYK